jgi:hypothetical protein
MKRLLLALFCLAGSASVVAADALTVLAWAPGYPGTTEQAQPSMDEFAHGVAVAAGWEPDDFRAIYSPEVEDGRARLAAGEAALAIVPLPVYLEFGESLRMRPLLRVIQQGGDDETWSLVAHKGALTAASDLSGWALQGHAGFSPRFVRRVLAGWGTLPEDVEIGFNARVLSVLRKASQGEPVAALLDRAQAEALGRLPFAAELEVVAVSSPMISSLVCAVDDRLPEAREETLVQALQGLDGSTDGDELLATIQVVRFEALGEGTLAGVQRLWGDAAD